MACAGLLTVCLLRPPAPERPRPPAPPPSAGPAGHALFQDVFHRADKNDDGKLSFEEFQNYFADGVLSPAELRELFSSIDGHPTDNLETEKLCDYFSEHLGVYQPVLAALESLNRAVLTAMDTTKLEYEQATKVDQFVTRFLLRETASQLQALQSSLEGASETLEAQARKPGPPGWSPCMKRSLPRGPTHTSLWPSGRYRWQRRPCKTSTVPCAAMWTSHGLRANACSECSRWGGGSRRARLGIWGSPEAPLVGAAPVAPALAWSGVFLVVQCVHPEAGRRLLHAV
ncbi:N-terminal EF-hand calcium-binding protein 3 isoform X3 [Erinaceus europaeus]|uniref:N-terminal EF-hand calcium-binding protein 3 isoform X3 n=1 Tax=Erinaceus europaeus TaxID=9365 RepID=A0ABM3X6Y4_ERIEU|nr:N-terminal EF-hand calcium-binding protein 3 isoform X3 [Erinaceus europaeus]